MHVSLSRWCVIVVGCVTFGAVWVWLWLWRYNYMNVKIQLKIEFLLWISIFLSLGSIFWIIVFGFYCSVSCAWISVYCGIIVIFYFWQNLFCVVLVGLNVLFNLANPHGEWHVSRSLATAPVCQVPSFTSYCNVELSCVVFFFAFDCSPSSPVQSLLFIGMLHEKRLIWWFVVSSMVIMLNQWS